MAFVYLFLLDFLSHWVAMYAAASAPAGTQSHKEKAENAPWILRLYYTNKIVLFIVCASQEATYLTLYVLGQGNATVLRFFNFSKLKTKRTLYFIFKKITVQYSPKFSF